MVRFLRFLFALLLLPFAAGLARAFVGVLYLTSAQGVSLFSAEVLALFAGFTSFLLVWTVLPAPARIYVFGHEMTHALWGLLFGARVSHMEVHATGGAVQLSKSNVWITLAPYFFPFYTMIVVLAALLVRCFASPLPFPCLWIFAVGFTWCFHVCFTLRSLFQRQPDILEYGRLFSWTLIWIFNLVGILLWMICTTELTFSAVFEEIWGRSIGIYRNTGLVFTELWHTVRVCF